MLISYGATVHGPSTIGGYGAGGEGRREIGPNALIDGATIEPGAIVGALARVGPGVTVPSGVEVMPGANVTTNAEASDPALGMVVPIPAADLTTLSRDLTNSRTLAAGYTTLYQGHSATGVSPGVAQRHHGGRPVQRQPRQRPRGRASSRARRPSRSSRRARPAPSFLGPKGKLVQAQLADFPARVTGEARFHALAGQVAARLGQEQLDRRRPGPADQLRLHQPDRQRRHDQLADRRAASPSAGSSRRSDGAVLLGGGSTTTTYVIGDQVTLGADSVVARSSLGNGTIVGSHAYVADSNLPANSVVPDSAIIINNKNVGSFQW